MRNIMLDLETMGNTPNSAIIAIGAVAFDTKFGITGKFYEVVDLESSVKSGLNMDASTVMWWLQQSESARNAFKTKGKTLEIVLHLFELWLGDGEQVVWGNGAAFDNVILASAYRATNRPVPWKFWNDRCYRTMKSLYPQVKMERTGTHHNALDDAESQALHLIEILKGMENT